MKRRLQPSYIQGILCFLLEDTATRTLSLCQLGAVQRPKGPAAQRTTLLLLVAGQETHQPPSRVLVGVQEAGKAADAGGHAQAGLEHVAGDAGEGRALGGACGTMR